MLLEGDLAKQFIEGVKGHVGHKIVVVYYGPKDDPVEFSLECETCGCVLVTAPVED